MPRCAKDSEKLGLAAFVQLEIDGRPSASQYIAAIPKATTRPQESGEARGALTPWEGLQPPAPRDECTLQVGDPTHGHRSVGSACG